MFEGIYIGLETAFTPINLLMVLVGCFAGTFIGMLPGLGPVSAIALMIPITYSLEPASGLILIAGVYYGAIFGGSTSAILINAPGVSGAVATAFDGYPLARAGKAGKALAIAAYSSFSGGTIAAILLLFCVPYLAKLSLSFQSSEYFALMVFGCTAVAAFSGEGQVLKALLMTFVGLMLATVGEDQSGAQRFTFGNSDLADGISFLLLSMATFALAEALSSILRQTAESRDDSSRLFSKVDYTSLKLNHGEVKEISAPIVRSSLLGFFIGVLPGAGATIASFLGYGMERNLASDDQKKQFGKGSAIGLAAPETANNAACTGSFVPLLTLGIPGSGTTAIMLGALLSYGVQPGPRLLIDNPSVFWSVIVSMYLGNVILLILNLPLIPYIAKILLVPFRYLTPIILFLSLMGVYLVSFNPADLMIMLVIGIVAVIFRILDYPLAPMLLGFILGGMLEENLRRALLIWDGTYNFIWERPLTLSIMLLALLSLLVPTLLSLYKVRSKNSQT
ncbi:MAG TPA: tripartite tricarboxylate transporter TctA [Porticoccaceae bacterium]|nr:tripartite tricarboxylate transporter TctA [Porticoccaceae bacterium]